MVTIKYKDNYELCCQGRINLGRLGVYVEDKIEIKTQYSRFDLEDMNEFERKNLLKGWNESYNYFLNKVENNTSKIENGFIVSFFMYLIDTEFDFSNCDDVIFINNGDPSNNNINNIYSKISGENYEKIYKILDNTEQGNLIGYKLFEEYLPMINIKEILKSIVPTFLELNEDFLDFEINSSQCDGELISSMVIRINSNLEVEIIDY